MPESSLTIELPTTSIPSPSVLSKLSSTLEIQSNFLIIKENEYKLINSQYFLTRQQTISYNNGKRAIRPIWALFDADWPCMWSENVIGTSAGDGVKWGCGVKLLQSPCIVYSVGSSNNWQFEVGIIRTAPQCNIFTFDPTLSASTITMPDIIKNKTKFYGFGIIGNSNKTEKKYKTLPEIMRYLNHTHIDILKMDVEGYEWDVFIELEKEYAMEFANNSMINDNSNLKNGSWPSIGQIYIEIHLAPKFKQQRNNTLRDLIEVYEDHGFRIFHKEVNAPWADCCSEYSLIQAQWNPDIKSYPMQRGFSQSKRSFGK